jgi:hypothetical protein
VCSCLELLNGGFEMKSASYDLYKNPAYLSAVNLSKSKVPNPFLVSAYLITIKIVSMWTAIQVFGEM